MTIPLLTGSRVTISLTAWLRASISKRRPKHRHADHATAAKRLTLNPAEARRYGGLAAQGEGAEGETCDGEAATSAMSRHTSPVPVVAATACMASTA